MVSQRPSELALEIEVHAVKQLCQEGEDFLLLDCREPHEYETARLEHARLIPMNQLPAKVAELEEYRDKRIVVHCHHGGRSLMVAQWLRQQGFANAQNMTGGIDAWSILIDRSVPRY